jgi:hypothetical protein
VVVFAVGRKLSGEQRHWEPTVKPIGVDLTGDGLDDLGAAVRLVAGRAVGMVGVEPVENAGAVQKVVHEGVDRDHRTTDFAPLRP